MFNPEILHNYAAWILDEKYRQVNTNKVDANQKQLDINQHHNLQEIQIYT